MPVLLDVMLDPTDLYTQGDQLRSVALLSYMNIGTATYLGVINQSTSNAYPVLTEDCSVLGMQGADWSQPAYPSLRTSIDMRAISNNNVIASTTGAIVPIPFGRTMMGSVGSEVAASTGLFVITGITKNSAGSPLGNCRVVALETGRIQIDGTPVVGEAISDGSGNYSIAVPTNVAFQLIAYKPGSPDVAGITRSDVVPAQV